MTESKNVKVDPETVLRFIVKTLNKVLMVKNDVTEFLDPLLNVCSSSTTKTNKKLNLFQVKKTCIVN